MKQFILKECSLGTAYGIILENYMNFYFLNALFCAQLTWTENKSSKSDIAMDFAIYDKTNLAISILIDKPSVAGTVLQIGG